MKNYLCLLLLAILLNQPLFSQNTLDNAGLTAATPAQVAYSLRKLSTSFTGNPIKVRRSSDNAEATISFDGSGGVTAGSLASFTPGVIIGPTLGTLQSGTVTTESAKTGTITIKPLETGTISSSNASNTVTGVGTSFTTELAVGDRLYNGTNNIFIGVVASITNNTTLLLSNKATVNYSMVAYKSGSAQVTGTGTNFTGQLSVGDRIFNNSNLYLGTVIGITNNTQMTLNAVDAVSATSIPFKGSTATVTGTGTNFSSLSVGDLLISNNTTLGTISSISSATSLTLTSKAGAAVSGLPFKSTAGTIVFSSFYSGTSVYLNTWYDQSGFARDAVQLKPSNQARIVNAGVLYTVNSRTSIEFSNALAAFVQTSTAASYLNNTLYTLNKVTAEASINPNLQFPISTTGGSGQSNSISHYGYRSSSQFTVAQYDNDQNFSATPSTSLEIHTSVKTSMAGSQFYKNGVLLGTVTSGAPSHLNNVGLLNIGFYTPTSSYYNGSVSEMMVFSTALSLANVTLLDDNQLAYYDIATTYWTGAVSTDWNTAGNWSTGVIPTISLPSIVKIPSGKPRYPVINSTCPANSISLESGTSLTITGTLQLAGTINSSGTCTASAGTIQYMGTAPQTILSSVFAGSAIGNIIMNNTTGVTLSGNLTVSNNLHFSTGQLILNTSTLTIGGTVTNTLSGGIKGSTNAGIIVTGTGSPTLSFDQTVPGTSNSLRNLTINSAGQVVTLANNLVLNNSGTTTFTAGKLSIGATTLTIRGLIVNTVNEGLRGGVNANLIMDGNSSSTISFDQTTPGTTNRVNTMTINCPNQSISLNRNTVVQTTLNLTAGTLYDGGYQLTSTGTLNLSGTLKLGSATVASVWPSFTTNNMLANGTVDYAAGIPQIVSAVPNYQNLTISATGGGVASNHLSVSGVLNLSAPNPSATSGTLSMGLHTLTMNALATTIGQGDVTGIVTRTTILPNVTYTMGNEFSSITFPNTGTLPTQMSMKITIGTAPTWGSGAIKRKYDFIQTGGSGTKAVINAHYLDTELNGNAESKLVDFSYRFTGSVLTEHGKSNANTIDNWVGLSNVNVAFFASTFGSVELSFDESALTTLTWNGSTSTSWITATNWTPNGGPSTNTILIIPDASTTPNDPYLPATASNGSVTIESGGILNADPGAQLTLNNAGLSWSNFGTFNASTSSVLFNNASATINGTTNFYNIGILPGASLLHSSESVVRIAGTMTNNGTWSTGLLHNTVEYNGNNQTVILPNGTTQAYHNLIINGTGTTVFPAGTLNILDGLTINGNISTAGNTVSMNGYAQQLIGGTSSPITLNNLIINNQTSEVVINQSLNVLNTLTFTAGKLSLNGQTLTLAGNIVNTVQNGIKGGTNSSLIVNSASSPTLSFDQSHPGISNALQQFTVNSAGQIPLLGSDLVVMTQLNLTAGKLDINGNTLTLNGGITNTNTGGLRGTNTSNLILGGGTNSPTISFDQTTPGTTNTLNSLTIQSNGQLATLDGPLQLNGVLNLTDGVINTTSTDLLTMTSTATYTGGNNLSFINGPLSRKTNGTSQYYFPVGMNHVYRPMSVRPAAATAGEYTAQYFPNLPPTGAHSLAVTAIATNEYWEVNKISGPDARIRLLYEANNTWSLGNPSTGSNIFLTELVAGTWSPVYGSAIPGNTGAGSTIVDSRDLSNLTSFTFAYSPTIILPVTLTHFKGEKSGNSNKLNWTTVNEYQFESFDIERSVDGILFTKIASVEALSGTGQKQYQWFDQSPPNGVSYYRLKMLDINQSFKLSSVIRLDRNAVNRISVYPNPVINNKVSVQLNGQQKGEYNFRLFDINGKRLHSVKFILEGTDNVISLPFGKTLPPGIYYLEITGPDNYIESIQLLVK